MKKRMRLRIPMAGTVLAVACGLLAGCQNMDERAGGTGPDLRTAEDFGVGLWLDARPARLALGHERLDGQIVDWEDGQFFEVVPGVLDERGTALPAGLPMRVRVTDGGGACLLDADGACLPEFQWRSTESGEALTLAGVRCGRPVAFDLELRSEPALAWPGVLVPPPAPTAALELQVDGGPQPLGAGLLRQALRVLATDVCGDPVSAFTLLLLEAEPPDVAALPQFVMTQDVDEGLGEAVFHLTYHESDADESVRVRISADGLVPSLDPDGHPIWVDGEVSAWLDVHLPAFAVSRRADEETSER